MNPEDPEAFYWSVKANEQRAVAALAQFESLSPHSPATYDMVGDLYRRRWTRAQENVSCLHI
jgi:hypothetical protein